MKKNILIPLGIIAAILIVSTIYYLSSKEGDNLNENKVENFEVCDEHGNRYPSDTGARSAGLSDAEFGATMCPEYKPDLSSTGEKYQDKLDTFHPGKIIASGEIKGTDYYIYSHYDLLNKFRESVVGKTAEEKKQAWKETVLPAIGPDFYRSYSFSEMSDEEYSTGFDEHLDKQFEYLTDENFELTTRTMKEMEPIFENRVREIVDNFDGMGDELHVMITSVGHAGAKARAVAQDSNRPMLFIMTNNILSYKGEDIKAEFFAENLLAHELVHSKHISYGTLGKILDPKSMLQSADYYWGLLIEGIAMYGDNEKVLHTPARQLYIDASGKDSFAGFEESDIPVLAREFLKIYDKKAFPESGESDWGMWFSASDKEIIGKQYPDSIGYLLGYLVIKDIVEHGEHTFEDIMKFDFGDPMLEKIVGDALKRMEGGQLSITTPDNYTIINFQEQFETFRATLNNPETKDPETLWNTLIEEPNQEFYDLVIWKKELKPDAEDERRKTLNGRFEKYRDQSLDYTATYELFQKKIELGTQAFQKMFPDFKLPIDIYLVPGVLWGGSVTSIDGKNYLPLGVDIFTEIGTDKLKDTLVPHELFHAHHINKSNVPGDGETWLSEGKMFWHLWSEGMATYVTTVMFPDLPLVDHFFANDENFKSETKRDAQLATLFLAEMDEPAIDFDDMHNSKKWFGTDSSSLGENVPPSIGYYLGHLVVADIINHEKVTLETVMFWDFQTARPHIYDSLKRIAERN